MLDKMELTDLSKYQTDFLFFKNEVLKLLNKIEEKQKKKENEFESYHEDIFNKQQQILLNFSNKIEDLSNIRFIEKSKLSKLDEIESKQDKIADTLQINTIRLSTCQKELSNAIYRFDKIYMENLLIPNLIGEYCKYRNLREYLEYNSSQITNMILTRDKHNSELEEQKAYVDNTVKQVHFRTETFLKTAFGFSNNAIKEYDATVRGLIKEVYGEFENVRIENHKYVIESKDRGEDLKKEQEKVVMIKNEILEKMAGYVEMIDKRNKTIDYTFEQMKKVYDGAKDFIGDCKLEMKRQANKLEQLQTEVKQFHQNNMNERLTRELIIEEFNNQLNGLSFKKKVIDIVVENFNSNAMNIPTGGSNHNNNGATNSYERNMLRTNSLFTGVISKPMNNNDAESGVKKYINGEITPSDLSSPKKKCQKSPVINLLRKPSQNSNIFSLSDNKATIISDLVLESQCIKNDEPNNNTSAEAHDVQNDITKQRSNARRIIQSLSNRDLQDLNPTPTPRCSNTNTTNANHVIALSDQKNKSIKSKIEIISRNDNNVTECKSSESIINETKMFSKVNNTFHWKFSNNKDKQKSASKSKLKSQDYQSKEKHKNNKKDIKIVIDKNDDKSLSQEREILEYNSQKVHRKEHSYEKAQGMHYNNRYPDSMTTPRNIAGSKSEAKIILSTDILQQQYMQGNEIERLKRYCLNDKLLEKLPKDPIERRLIQVEYYTKKKFDELISELQKYIPLTFKSHTKYNLNIFEDTAYSNMFNKSNYNKGSSYNGDLNKAKISVASTEVIEHNSMNMNLNSTVYKSFFPKHKHKPTIQIIKDKPLSSFRHGIQSQKDKKINNGKHANANSSNNIFSEGPSTTYVALSKILTNQPKIIPLVNENQISFNN